MQKRLALSGRPSCVYSKSFVEIAGIPALVHTGEHLHLYCSLNKPRTAFTGTTYQEHLHPVLLFEPVTNPSRKTAMSKQEIS